MLERFKTLSQKKVMGVKVLYLALVFALALLFFAWKAKDAGIADDEATDTGTDGEQTGELTPEETAVDYPDFDGTDTIRPGTATETTDPTVTTPEYTTETNETWGRKAIQWLVKNAGATTDGASIAIQKYLNGDQLSFAEGQLRDKAVAALDFPPTIPPSGGTIGKPVTPAPVVKTYNPPAVHKVAGTSDNTWTELSKLYYKSTSDASIDTIQAANAGASWFKHSGEIPKGTSVTIPPKPVVKYFTATKTVRTAAQIARKNALSEKSLRELNDKTTFPVAVGKKVRVR